MRDIMIDIETLGVKPGCMILSIGATNGKDDFHVRLNLDDQFDYGLIIEPRTVLWWLDQSKEAQESLTKEQGYPIVEAFQHLARSFDWENNRVWCNGASFDFPILKEAHAKVGMTLPWPYYNEMDFRTIKNLVPKDVFNDLRAKPLIAHDGLEDARAQWLTLQNLLNWLENHHVNLPRAKVAA